MSEAAWGVPPSMLSVPAGAESFGQGTLPVQFPFSRKCRASGLAMSTASAGLIGTGLFLLSQVAATPGVAVQLSAVGLLLTAAGLAVLYGASQRLFGALTVDRRGVSLSPSLSGFAIPWDRLCRWEVRDRSFPITGLPMVRFWADGRALEFAVPSGSLGDEELLAVRRALLEFAPDREYRDARTVLGTFRDRATGRDAVM